jgi:hypothetical protein
MVNGEKQGVRVRPLPPSAAAGRTDLATEENGGRHLCRSPLPSSLPIRVFPKKDAIIGPAIPRVRF